ncbi:MAG: hypothetical protein ACREP9_05790, partial [Candidatus Dormibacteraceae bacterium]
MACGTGDSLRNDPALAHLQPVGFIVDRIEPMQSLLLNMQRGPMARTAEVLKVLRAQPGGIIDERRSGFLILPELPHRRRVFRSGSV